MIYELAALLKADTTCSVIANREAQDNVFEVFFKLIFLFFRWIILWINSV